MKTFTNAKLKILYYLKNSEKNNIDIFLVNIYTVQIIKIVMKIIDETEYF